MHSRDLKKAGETDDRLFAVAGQSVLCRSRTSRPRPQRGGYPDIRQAGPGSGQHLGGGVAALQREGTGRPANRDRQHQRVEPPQCRSQAGSRRLERLSGQGPHSCFR